MLSQLGFGVIAKMIFSNLTKHETAKRYPFCYLDTLWQCLSLCFDRIQKAVKLQNNSHLQMAIFLHCLNVSTTPLPQWGFRQCLSFSLTTLRGKHCRHPNADTDCRYVCAFSIMFWHFKFCNNRRNFLASLYAKKEFKLGQ